MASPTADVEALLKRALAPVEPPPDLALRLESTLSELTDAAADELEGWELSSMRDPRNWMRPVVAGVVGGGAGTALVALRVHQSRRRRRAAASSPADLLGRTLRDVEREARRLLDR